MRSLRPDERVISGNLAKTIAGKRQEEGMEGPTFLGVLTLNIHLFTKERSYAPVASTSKRKVNPYGRPETTRICCTCPVFANTTLRITVPLILILSSICCISGSGFVKQASFTSISLPVYIFSSVDGETSIPFGYGIGERFFSMDRLPSFRFGHLDQVAEERPFKELEVYQHPCA